MSYRISGRSQAWGVDADAVKAAFRDFVHALDQATIDADDEGTPVELELVFGDWQGDDSTDHPDRLTAAEVRTGA